MTNDELRIPVSVFQNAEDKHPEPHELTWRALANRLCRYTERPTKDGKAWSPATYLPGTTRGKANVDQVYALVLDVDHGGEYWPLLEGREFQAHTTFQHTPDAPRWRVTLPLSRPVSGPHWPEFWLRAQAYFGGCVDPQTKDASRLFYLPSCPPGAQHEEKWQHGELLDPDSLPEMPRYEPPAAVRAGGPRLVTRYLADWAARFSLAGTDKLRAMPPESGRNGACNRLAYTLAGLAADPVHELSQEWVEELLFSACVQNQLVADTSEYKVRATIKSGWEDGWVRPWSPSDRDAPDNMRSFVGREQHNGAPAAEHGMRLHVTFASKVAPEPITWLWRNRLARGKATLLIGDPGLGKSLISDWLASIVSVGSTWPDEGECEQGMAILFGIEDALADTVVPRLMAASADLDRVAIVQEVINADDPLDTRMFALEEHIVLLEELINAHHATLVVMDPVTAYLGPNINAHKDSDVRRVLGPLQMMAERTGVALLLLMHLTKGSGVSALYRATGSIAFPAVCRVVLGVAPDPNDESGKRRLLLPVKFNIAPEATGIGYHIETTQQSILPGVNERDQPPIIIWDDEPVLVDAQSALDRSGTVQEMGALAECKAALAQVMAANNYRVLAREGERQLKEAGVSTSPNVLVRARRELGIKTTKVSWDGPWYWEGVPKKQELSRTHARERENNLRNLAKDQATLQRYQEAAQGYPNGTEQSPKNGLDSQESSHARMREAPDGEELRLCAQCRGHFTLDAYDRHLPTCSPELPPELCPVHRKLFSLHDCDQL